LGLAYCFGCGLPVLYDTTAHCLLLPLFQNIRLKFGTEVALVIPQAELIFDSHYVCKLMRLIFKKKKVNALDLLLTALFFFFFCILTAQKSLCNGGEYCPPFYGKNSAGVLQA
jgi:hypothetical protein